MTTPVLHAPFTLGADVQLTVRYTDLTSDTVDINAGTKYVLGDGSSSDWIQELSDALNGDAEGTYAVTLHELTRGHCRITKTSGAKTLLQIDFVPTFPARLFGFSSSDSSNSITSSVLGNSAFRCAYLWAPGWPDDRARPDPGSIVIGAHTGSGNGSADDYSRPDRWSHNLTEIYAAEVFEYFRQQTDHAANVPVSRFDTNVTLEAFLVTLRGLLNGQIPTLKWVPSLSDPTTQRDVRILNFDLYGSPRAWIAETNDAPLWYELEWQMAEVGS